MNLAIVAFEHIVSKSVKWASMARFNGKAVVIVAHLGCGVLVRYCNSNRAVFTVSLADLTEF